MAEADKELELLRAKRMLELRRRFAKTEKVKERTPRDILAAKLVDRGLEVLQAAESLYPKETKAITEKLSSLIEKGTLKGYISGGELLWLFRALGLRVRVETTISVEKGGRLVSLADKLKSDRS